MFTSSNICNHTPPSTSPSPWQLLAGIKSERTGTNEMRCRNGRLLQVLRETKKKVIFFFLPFFSPSLFTAGKKIKKGMKKMKMKKKRRRPLNEEGEQRSRSSNLEEQRDKDRNLTREPVCSRKDETSLGSGAAL